MPYEELFKDKLAIKLMILYAVREYKKPLTNSLLTKLVTENNEINFFDLQYGISELVKIEDLYGFEEDGSHFYRLTPDGQSSIEYFEHKLPLVIRNRLRKSVKAQLDSEKPITDTITDYTPEGDGFLSTIKILENGIEQFSLSLYLPTRETAKATCEYFKHNIEDIYKYINKNVGEIV